MTHDAIACKGLSSLIRQAHEFRNFLDRAMARSISTLSLTCKQLAQSRPRGHVKINNTFYF